MRIKILVLSLCIIALVSEHVSAQDSARTTFTLAALYSTNANYYGQKAADKLPYVLANATVRFPSGFYFSGMAYRLLNDETSSVSATNLNAGLQFNIAPRLTADMNYSHTFFPKNSPFLHAANANTAGASLSLEHVLTTSLAADYAFGEQQDLFVTFSNSRAISIGSVFDNKDLLQFTPALEVVAGSTHFYETYVIEKQRRDSLLGLPIFNPFPDSNEQQTEQRLAKDFDLFSYNLRLPLAYSRSRYLLEASCQLSWLHNDINNGATKPASFFNFSFYYQF